MVLVERSRDQTKMAERLNGIKTSTNISFKTRNSYRNSASITIFCFESLSDSELRLSLFGAIFVYCSAHVLAYLIHRVDYGERRNMLSHLIHIIFWEYYEHIEPYESSTTQVHTRQGNVGEIKKKSRSGNFMLCRRKMNVC